MSSQLGQIFVLIEQIEAGTLALPPTTPILAWSATRASHFIRYVSYLSVPPPLPLLPPPPLAHPFYSLSFFAMWPSCACVAHVDTPRIVRLFFGMEKSKAQSRGLRVARVARVDRVA